MYSIKLLAILQTLSTTDSHYWLKCDCLKNTLCELSNRSFISMHYTCLLESYDYISGKRLTVMVNPSTLTLLQCLSIEVPSSTKSALLALSSFGRSCVFDWLTRRIKSIWLVNMVAAVHAAVTDNNMKYGQIWYMKIGRRLSTNFCNIFRRFARKF